MRMSYRLRVFLLFTLTFAGASVAWSLIRWEAHAPQRQAWADLASTLRAQRAAIDSLEAGIATLQAGVEEARAGMVSSARRLGHYGGGAADGRLPSPRYRAYMAEIERHNGVVGRHNEGVGRLQEMYGEYSDLVDRHNVLVDSANSMQRRAAEEGYALPDPELPR